MHARLRPGRNRAFVVAAVAARRVIPLKPAGAGRAAELEGQGYARQTTIAEPRLSELVETYRALGYDVEVIEHRSEGDACGVCYEADGERGVVYGDIYTRKRADGAAPDDPLF